MAPTTRNNLRVGLNKGRSVTAIPKVARPAHRKGKLSERNKFVRSVVREVVGFSPYERRDKKARKLTKKRLGTLLRSKRKVEELQTIIQETRKH
ncbi:SubName: Full=Related to 60S ribosomal protein L36-Cryptococcus neoformans {ECO:0000313/EMBL:CCA67277.1} [Serendipita indica DSM 11827]|uniref:Related to 60S ribosomal protein L36-Cryptococcus neoformans n=1 Tax=Serendipita indica (strain DSM 11827) TaxID=1109443 RepID=G4T7I7_SERID|nr:SubName: Full=Related to 60S ribosomal protein L36-Cryptococcus neoformans {ECO:0000313/EMBL:CCA67277.1} [Serendipita indica DSM 11827]CCA67277.1 related to 60S ribosomal protein L36-Cryptococcus neoformans [Serendipita indica DSM 11827]